MDIWCTPWWGVKLQILQKFGGLNIEKKTKKVDKRWIIRWKFSNLRFKRWSVCKNFIYFFLSTLFSIKTLLSAPSSCTKRVGTFHLCHNCSENDESVTIRCLCLFYEKVENLRWRCTSTFDTPHQRCKFSKNQGGGGTPLHLIHLGA